MSELLCEICKIRPAVAQVNVLENGRRKSLRVCAQDLRKLQQRSASPFDRLFGGSLFDDLSQDLDESGGLPSGREQSLPRHREAVDIDQYLSAHAKELLQNAAQTALKFKRNEVDTEHLLYAISDSDVVREIYKQFKVNPDDIRAT